MKPESLQALLIDRELGELSSDTIELLEAWLADHPESAAAIPPLRRTLATTKTAVRRYPALARPGLDAIQLPRWRVGWAPLALAASVLILLGGTAWVGFRAGRQSAQQIMARSQIKPGEGPPAKAVNAGGPWARYALASSPHGGLRVVRRDLHH
jgi:ferric-dicitrate binding protein FerR (iron transport regulator)